jgi:hypothetical protein
MRIEIYTSQSLDYYNSIGKYSLASAIKFSPDETEIVVTTEDFDKFPRLVNPITLVDLYSINNGFKEFENHWTGKAMHKVINFAKKGYTVLHALENSSADLMIWLDADAFIKKPIKVDEILTVLNGNLSSHLGVTHDSGEFTVESGFFIFDLNHPGRADFARIYRDYYDNGKCENMGRFYDSNVHGHTVKDCETLGHTFTEMNLRQKGNTPLRGSMVENLAGHFKGKVKREAEAVYISLGLDNIITEIKNDQ